MQKTKVDIFKMARVSNVLGAVDGTLIKILAPSKDEQSCICRKGFHTLNVHAVADSSLRKKSKHMKLYNTYLIIY